MNPQNFVKNLKSIKNKFPNSQLPSLYGPVSKTF